MCHCATREVKYLTYSAIFLLFHGFMTPPNFFFLNYSIIVNTDIDYSFGNITKFHYNCGTKFAEDFEKKREKKKSEKKKKKNHFYKQYVSGNRMKVSLCCFGGIGHHMHNSIKVRIIMLMVLSASP